jgi:hypothetical protein
MIVGYMERPVFNMMGVHKTEVFYLHSLHSISKHRAIAEAGLTIAIKRFERTLRCWVDALSVRFWEG